MSRLLIMGMAAVSAVCLAAGESRAQTYYGSSCCACSCAAVGTTVGAPVQTGAPVRSAAGQAAGVQSYQRYSYAPAPAGAQVGAQPAVVGSAPMSYAPTYVAPSYRSYDAQSTYYGGGGYSRNAGNLWQYPKGDMRRQMH